ncbi:hypothetical protein [Amycolatopsis sp. NPDC049159]|uniref:hypothetical protein n=1 Tax=Amycolatopsis sp. NPDC049159 TaxID=3157210 RepID=UPI0033F4F15E
MAGPVAPGELRFFFDNGVVLWAEVGPADLAALPLSEGLRAELDNLAELGPGWVVEDGFTELHEDPELDRYLADPKGFQR